MINVHLNGDIVRCPDISAIQTRLKETRDKERRCVYGLHEWRCRSFFEYCNSKPEIKQLSSFGRCTLSGCDLCQYHKQRIETGSMEKTFKIDNTVYRKIASAGHYMIKERPKKTKTLFITLTFPKFKIKPDEKLINKCFSDFIHKLHENYGVEHYISVRERGEKNGRYHFHVLLNIRFYDFRVLNRAWCDSISDIADYSNNALQTDRKSFTIIRAGNALRYICKYFAKNRGAKSKTRIVFMSMPLILKPKKEYCTIEDILSGYKSIYIKQTSDYTTLFRITDSKEFDRFCNTYLYALFELSDQKADFIYSN